MSSRPTDHTLATYYISSARCIVEAACTDRRFRLSGDKVLPVRSVLDDLFPLAASVVSNFADAWSNLPSAGTRIWDQNTDYGVLSFTLVGIPARAQTTAPDSPVAILLIAAAAAASTGDTDASDESDELIRSEERARLSAELHDGIAPELAGLKLSMESIAYSLAQRSPTLAATIEQWVGRLQQTTIELRKLYTGLAPKALALGFVPAVETLCRNCGERVVCTFTGDPGRLPQRQQVAAYRVIQESVNNALKYADAQRIAVQIVVSDDCSTVIVEDDGIGCRIDKIVGGESMMNHGYGIENMRARVNQTGGEFEFRSQESLGTTVIASWIRSTD